MPYRIVTQFMDQTYDSAWNRIDNARAYAKSEAERNHTLVDVYFEQYNQSPLRLCSYTPESGWTKVNDEPMSTCCPSKSYADHLLCDDEDCIAADRPGIHVPHKGSSMCQSGKRPHCTCDRCY